MDIRDARKEAISKVGKAAKGRAEILKHLEGKRLTQRQAILAKCYDCMGYYADGKISCGIPDCPLFPLMPFSNVSEEEGETA
jgi:hypothetical protein